MWAIIFPTPTPPPSSFSVALFHYSPFGDRMIIETPDPSAIIYCQGFYCGKIGISGTAVCVPSIFACAISRLISVINAHVVLSLLIEYSEHTQHSMNNNIIAIIIHEVELDKEREWYFATVKRQEDCLWLINMYSCSEVYYIYNDGNLKPVYSTLQLFGL